MDITALLKKMVKRTERDVAFAGTVLSVAQSCVPKVPEKEYFSRLTIYLHSGGSMWWECIRPIGAPNASWNHFLKWFHGRTGSPHFVQIHREGSDCVPRSEIRRYDIRHGEREKATSA